MDAIITVSAMIENLKPDFVMSRGICSYVWLFALPKTALSVLRVKTDLENENKTGIITLREKIHYYADIKNAKTVYTLFSNDGKEIELYPSESVATLEDGSVSKKFFIGS